MQKKRSHLRFLLKSHTFLNALKHKRNLKKHVYDSLSPIERMNAIGTLRCGYSFDLEHPRSFNEKISYLKFFYRNPLWEKVADKHECKKFLEEIGLGEYVVPEYGVYSSSSEIDLDALPDEFVLKATHDCGSVFVCKKGKTNFQEVFQKLDASLKSNYEARHNNFEWVYENIKPRIIAEKVLHPLKKEKDVYDYKFMMSNHQLLWGYVISNRSIDERIDCFDQNGNALKVEHVCLGNSKKKKERLLSVSCFNSMKEAAEEISAHFLFVRVDFMLAKEGFFISELTFFPTSGTGTFSKKKIDFELGSQIILQN